ncbi:DHH family phosphoesterase [Lignipirellula cremea]|uniref:NanoRNase/pAp phosphatase n=1 Tax=Lignipirellula cremea TaxID=2528010 RepID=A0A518DZK8_9BACT|nr:DHH family phosphoesterase [Lignipirellula cremea]QDU97278.1 NanoRNase/pAp phosphatase [Lignipirellula cremea]
MSIDWPALVALIGAHERFLLTSHIRPDCDALGSELGMMGVLESLGKDVRIVNGHPTPPNLAFIDPDLRIETLGQGVEVADLDDREVMMILDTSAWAQLGPMGEVVKATPAKKLIFDHHVSEDDLGAALYKNTTAEATGRLVAELAEHLHVPLTPAIATPLFAAVATDTGWFRFPSASPSCYEYMAKLITAGASPPAIYAALYEQDTVGRVKLRGRILANIEVELDGRLAYTFALKEDFTETGALPSDTEDVVNMLLGIAGVEVAVIMVEQATGGFKLSFRSQCELNCSEVAGLFGGGGHRAAAGAFIEGSLSEAQPVVLDGVRKAMR